MAQRVPQPLLAMERHSGKLGSRISATLACASISIGATQGATCRSCHRPRRTSIRLFWRTHQRKDLVTLDTRRNISIASWRRTATGIRRSRASPTAKLGSSPWCSANPEGSSAISPTTTLFISDPLRTKSRLGHPRCTFSESGRGLVEQPERRSKPIRPAAPGNGQAQFSGHVEALSAYLTVLSK